MHTVQCSIIIIATCMYITMTDQYMQLRTLGEQFPGCFCVMAIGFPIHHRPLLDLSIVIFSTL